MAWYKCSSGGEGIPLITKSGSIVEYEDAVGGVPINDLVAEITPIQAGSGDPYPMGGSAQKWDEEWEVGGINDTTGQPISETNKIRSKNFFAVLSGETYYVVAPQPIRVLFYASDESFISETANIRNATFSVPANATKAKLRGTADYGTTYNNDISINYPATDRQYHKWSNVRAISGFTEGVMYHNYTNHFDKSAVTPGKYLNANGYLIDSTSSCVSDYIEVNDYFLYSGLASVGSAYRGCFYNSSKTLIEAFTESTTQTLMKCPANTKYVRISINNADVDNVFCGTGDTTETRSFGQTVYGGTWKASEGKVVPWTRLVVDSTNASIIKSSTTNRWYIRPQDCGAVITGVDNTLIACDKMKQGTGIREDNRVFINDSGAIRFNTATAYESASALVTGFGGEITFIFEANTPTEISVEPVLMETIEGENNVFVNTGDLTAKFYKSSVSNLDMLVEQTKDLAPDIIALASAVDGTSTREAFDMTDETTGTKATRIPDYMFYKNLNVEKINLSTVEVVGSNSFYMCPYITEINLPNATELKSSAFNASSRSLTSPTPMVINLPSCTNIADSALREMGYAGTPCTITLTACETLQGNAIRGASARYFTIDTLDLPAVKTIGQESFNYHQFTNVIIGTACTSIASKPFNYCTITNLTVKATTPPTLNANGLGCTPTHIYVPADSVATYKAASNWSTYASIIEAIPT